MAEGLLLLHAFPLDARMWEPQVRALERAVPVVAPHAPGFGGSPPSGPVLTMDEVADRAVDAALQAGVERAVVCGLSMGGYAAFRLWRRHRERVLGLVLANTRAVPDDQEGRERRRALAARVLAEGVGFLAESPPPLLSPETPEDLWREVRETIRAQRPEAVAAASLGMAERPDSTPDLPGITVPTLVITSTADALVPPEVSAAMAERIPGARLAVLEGAGHLSNLERPEEFTELLRDHLARCGLLPADG